VTIARSLVNNPAIIWADEPTGALDSKSATDIMQLLRDLNEQHDLTIVLVTHDAGVGAQCHRIVRMQDGAIVGEEFPNGHRVEMAHKVPDTHPQAATATA
jgi:ABC-type lipoprotein export system ATPase subunit